MSAEEHYIGRRVREALVNRRMKQQELANLIRVDKTYVNKIVNGRKAVTSFPLIVAIAEALDMSVAELVSMPPQVRGPLEEALHNAVPGIRSALDGAEEEPPLPFALLDGQVEALMLARMDCNYLALARMAASTLSRCLAMAESTGNPPAYELIAKTCLAIALAIKPLGHVDLATRLAERGQWAAQMTGDPVVALAAEFGRAQCALAGGIRGLRRHSLNISSAAADQAQLLTGRDGGLAWGVMLNLHAALSAARLGNHDLAADRMTQAKELARHVRGDDWFMEPTVTNADLWHVDVLLTRGDPGRATELADQIDLSMLVHPQRKARLFVDSGRGWYERGNPERAVAMFLRADEIAPAEVRSRTTVHEITAHILMAERRKAGSPALRMLADRLRIEESS